MGKIFKNDVSVLFNNNPISKDFHLYECGYEECKPTKPYEFVPIDYWVIHYCIAGEGIFQIEDKQNHIKAGDIFMIPPYTKTNIILYLKILGVIIGSVYAENKFTNF